jgi:hypothetical protein
MNWSGLRRIVTDERDGKSRVLIDGEAAKLLAVGETGLAEIWEALTDETEIYAAKDRLADEDVRLEPRRGAVRVRWFTVAPEDPKADRKAMDEMAAQTFAAIGAAHARVDVKRHPMMHRTDTLDAVILVKGEVDLLLDAGEVRSLKPGDVVIQRATNHAWVNRGKETALLVAVLISPR